MNQRQEIYCHECGNYVQFEIDLELNGNHVLTCPKCGHEHCRVVVDGEITGERWDSRNGNTISVSTATVTWSTISTLMTYQTISTGWYSPGAMPSPSPVPIATQVVNDSATSIQDSANRQRMYGSANNVAFLYDSWARLASSS